METFTSLAEAIRYWGKVNGNKPAFIFRNISGGRQVLTWEALYHLAGRWAAILRADGLGRGQIVMNALPNSLERIVCEAGILLCGAASADATYHLADGSDLITTLQKSRASAIFVNPDVISSPWNVLQKHLSLGVGFHVTSEEMPDLHYVYRIRAAGEDDFLKQLETSSQSFEATDVRSDDVCTVFTTSGSTGACKMVIFTHGTLIKAYKVFTLMTNTLQISHIDFNMSPLGWVSAHPDIVFYRGCTRVISDVVGKRPEDVAEFSWKVIQEEKCHTATIPPVYFRSLVEHVKQTMQSEKGVQPWLLKTIVLGGQPITSSILKGFGTVCQSVTVLYASTECNWISFQTLTENVSFQNYDAGLPFPGVQVKIVGENDEESLATEVTGNILVKSPSLMKGYLNDPEKTAAAFIEDGFFRTGDIGKMTSEGHLIVLGRGSDAIMRGTSIFYPGWLETRIRACPQVSDVMVVGIPDPILHEELCACLVLASADATVEDVREFVNEDFLPLEEDLESPRPHFYLKFEQFPLTKTGKLNRLEVKKMAAALLQEIPEHMK